MLDTFNRIDDVLDSNARLAEQVYHFMVEMTGLDLPESGGNVWGATLKSESESATARNAAKAASTIHQSYRDWSAEGAVERDPAFKRVFADLEFYLPRRSSPGGSAGRILVPGCGLARLLYELTKPRTGASGETSKGFDAEGNEFSYHQAYAALYVLDGGVAPGEFEIHPWAHVSANHISREDQLRGVRVPDICPAEEKAAAAEDGSDGLWGDLSIATGEFADVYGPHVGGAGGCYDAVVTLFFLDTARDPLAYVQAVRHCLRTGGVWINIGPLLWHHEREGEDGEGHDGDERRRSRMGVSLSNDEVIKLLLGEGFVLERQEVMGEIGYVSNEKSLAFNRWRPVHWVAKKRE